MSGSAAGAGARAGLSERLNAIMASQGVTGTELARTTGIPQTTLHRLMASPDANPRLDTLEKLAEALNVSLAYLLTDTPVEGGPGTPGDPREVALDTLIEEMRQALSRRRLTREDIELMRSTHRHLVAKTATPR